MLRSYLARVPPRSVVQQTQIEILGLAHRGFKREMRSEEHTSELQSQSNLVCRLLLEKKTSLHAREPGRVLTGPIKRRSHRGPLHREADFSRNGSGPVWPGTRVRSRRLSSNSIHHLP